MYVPSYCVSMKNMCSHVLDMVQYPLFWSNLASWKFPSGIRQDVHSKAMFVRCKIATVLPIHSMGFLFSEDDPQEVVDSERWFINPIH